MIVDTLSFLSWVLFLIAVTGAILNVKKFWIGFGVWSVSNGGWMLYNIHIGQTAQAAQNFVFFIISLKGVWEWWGKAYFSARMHVQPSSAQEVYHA